MSEVTDQIEMAKALYAKPQPSDETAKPEMHSKLRDIPDQRRRQLMVAMWHRMGAFFGSTWESQYGGVNEQTIGAWSGALSDFTVGELAGAIKACEQWESKFPPTWPEFRALLLSVRNASRPNVTQQRIEREANTPLIEHLKRHALTPIAKREIERMERILAGEDVETKRESWNKLGLSRTHGPLPEYVK